MRDCKAVVVLALAMVLPTACRGSGTSSAEQEIRVLLGEQMRAANAHDTDGFLATYLHTSQLEFVVNGTIIHGWDALREQQLKWWQNGKSDAVYRARGPIEFQVLSAGTVLVTEPLSSHRTLPNGQPKDGSFVITMIWRRRPEGWRVTYAHESWMS